MPTPLVSVAITTYNHEKYIAKAVNSALEQETDFPYEIVIGEDASTDATREVLLALRDKHPDKIRLALRDRSEAEHWRQRGLGGKLNYIRTLEACGGKYIALLDGDDFWTDAHKLQKQVDFLEAHPDYAICFHNALYEYEDGSQRSHVYSPPGQKLDSDIEDLLEGNFMVPGTVMFRNFPFGRWPDWYYTSLMGDWPLFVFSAQHGKIRYLSDVMTTQLHHPQTFWSSRPHEQRLVSTIQVLGHLNAYLGNRYHLITSTAQCRYLNELFDLYAKQGELKHARSALIRLIRTKLSLRQLPSREQLSMLIELCFPVLYRRRTRDLTELRENLGVDSGAGQFLDPLSQKEAMITLLKAVADERLRLLEASDAARVELVAQVEARDRTLAEKERAIEELVRTQKQEADAATDDQAV